MALPIQLQMLMNEAGTRLTKAHDALIEYGKLGFSHMKVTEARTTMEEAGGYLAQVQSTLNALYAQNTNLQINVGQPVEVSPAPPEHAPEPHTQLSRLTGQALHDALVGAKGDNGLYVVSPEYVQAYNVGGYYYNPSYTAIAQMTPETLAELQDRFPTPQEWVAAFGGDPATIAGDWATALALSGVA